MRKTASTAVSVHPLLAERWSPRGFDRAHEIGDEALAALIEAARWAPSAQNSQPWRSSYITAYIHRMMRL